MQGTRRTGIQRPQTKKHQGQSRQRRPQVRGREDPRASAADDNLTQREQTMVRRKNKGAGRYTQ